MQLHRFDSVSAAARPWKNGGGTTRELACWPPGAGTDGFDWRISIATIDRPGPFSTFAGIDRVILLLGGAGVRLRSEGGAIDHRLAEALTPFAFPGDVPLECELLDGGCTDLNVMTRRACVRADVRVWRCGDAMTASRAGLMLAIGGVWTIQPEGGENSVLKPGSGLWWADGSTGCRVTTTTDDASLVVVRIESTPVDRD